jgi:hypothetical protein
MMRPGRVAAASFVLGGLTLVGALALGAPAALADDDDGIGITVTVSPAPTDPATTGGAGTSGGSSGSRPTRGSTTAVDDAVAPSPDEPAPVLEDDEVDLGGILFVSGLRSEYAWSINPLGGETETMLTVRNVSKTTFSSTVRFWADGPFGNRLSEVTGVAITDLKPGESRTVVGTLGGIGQSTFVQVHATLNPPKTVDGVELDPITRDAFVVVPPWGVLSLGVVGAVGFAGFSLVQFLRRPEMLSGPALAGVPA